MADDLGLSKLTGGLSFDSVQSGLYGYAIWIIYGILALGVAVFGWMKWQDKKIYIYPVRIYRQRNNGQVKEFNTFGGYIKKGNISQFSIKMTRFKKKTADKLPLSEYMDEDNRIYYWQLNPDAPLIQIKREFKVEQILVPNDRFIEPSKEEVDRAIKYAILELNDKEETKKLSEEEKRTIAERMVNEEIEARRNTLIDETFPTYSPVPTDLKQQALTDINNYKQTLGVDVNKQFMYFVAGVIALAILGIVIFYIAMNKGDVPIITK
jgi:hypothetical protein